ncbi:MAG: leucine-rich repeat protein [Lachnospiraceae bacterium]|nr:leucine-rich repeat protein [Lachnospiraceae bacterium]
MFEKNAFDGNESGDTGQVADENAENKKSVEDGNDELIQQDQNNDSTVIGNNGNNQNGTGATAVTDGSGEKTVGGNAGGAGNGNGTGTGNGSGAGANTDSGSSSGGSNENGNNTDNGSQSGSGTGTIVNPYPGYIHIDPDDATYGEDPAESNKSESNGDLTNAPLSTMTVWVELFPKDDPVFLLPSDHPSSSKMTDYLNVVIAVESRRGSNRYENVNYSYNNNKEEYGGDYYIDWDATTDVLEDQASQALGAHTAKVRVYDTKTGKLCNNAKDGDTFTYYVIDYSVKLIDLKEDFQDPSEEYIQTIHLTNSYTTSLVEPRKNFNKKILERTEDTARDYEYVFQKNKKGNYVNSFMGWSTTPGGSSVGNQYTFPEAKMEDIVNSGDQYSYELTLYPVWSEKADKDSLFNISIASDGAFIVDGYNGDANSITRMALPDDVFEVDFNAMGAKTFPKLEVIKLSKDISKIVYPNDIDSFPSLKAFGVADENQHFVDVAGILYDKTGTKLVRVPWGIKDIISWSKYLTVIEPYAFQNTKIEQVTLPESFYELGPHAFADAQIGILRCLTDQTLEFGNAVFTTNDADKLSVEQIMVKDGESDNIFKNDLLKLYSFLLQEGYTDADQLASVTLKTSSGPIAEYSIDGGWLLSAGGTKIEAATEALLIENHSVRVPDGVQVIGKDVIKDLQGLENLYLPDSISVLEDGCFESSTLIHIYFESSSAPDLDGNGTLFGRNNNTSVQLYIPGTAYETYYDKWVGSSLNTSYGSEGVMYFLHPQGDNVITDDDGVVYVELQDGSRILLDGKSASGEYTLNANTTKIRPYAFCENKNITAVRVPAGTELVSIGAHSFDMCSSMSRFVWESISATKSLERIGEYAFYATALTGLPDTMISEIPRVTEGSGTPTAIGTYDCCVIFEGEYREGRTPVPLFTKLEFIGTNAFAECKQMVKMSIPKNDIMVNDKAFKDWNEMASYHFKNVWFVNSGSEPDESDPNPPQPVSLSTYVQPIGSVKAAISGGSGDGGEIMSLDETAMFGLMKPNQESTEEETLTTETAEDEETVEDVHAVVSPEDILDVQEYLTSITVSDDILRYIAVLCEATRDSELVEMGVSPRGALALGQIVRAHALLMKRDYVIPEDVQAVFLDVCEHRMIMRSQARIEDISARDFLLGILADVNPPGMGIEKKKIRRD